ncbi:MAG: radical SAM protein [Candidatus Aminicenantes bacterium]|nr:radical SAM protein [Candidatus Aminicenantes bacterium]
MNARKIERIERALSAWEGQETDCALCPRECHADRSRGPTGYCRTGTKAVIASALLHFGEEPVLSGLHDCADSESSNVSRRGSGTIFFCGCNLRCLFCQNYQISWLGRGRPVEDEELADMMLDLERRGALNINLVSPTQAILPILRALRLALARRLSLPLVYNTNGYERADVIERLAGIVDIYLPDCKYALSEPAARLSGAADYFDHAGPALQEMFVQQPDLILDAGGFASAGTIFRHLVLPGQVPNSLAVCDWLAETFRPTVPLSLMSQYQPCWRAPEDLRRPLLPDEYGAVLDRARRLGFDPLFVQSALFAEDEHLNPDFERKSPFHWKRRND